MEKQLPYHLPESYRENPVISYDWDESASYWSPARIKSAMLHQRAVYQWAGEIIKSTNIRSVADVGCGFAHKLAWLHAAHPTVEFCGIDQPSAIALCKDHYDFGEWVGTNFEGHPKLPAGKFDLIISSDVIEHLGDPDQLLSYIRQIAAPNAYVLISTPERDLLRGKNNLECPNRAHVREWNRDEFSKYVESRGFVVEAHRILPAYGFTLSGKYLKKLAKRVLRGKSLYYNQALLAKVA